MTTGHVFIAASLDGYIARPDGGLDWLMKQDVDGEDHGYKAFMDSVDGLIMGRATFETVLTFDEWSYDKEVIVMSRSLGPENIPGTLKSKVRLSSQAPAEVMKSLDKEGWRRAYVDGGELVQSFLRDGLIADIILTRIPILLGSGRALFGEIRQDIDLVHDETVSYPSGLVTSKYSVSGPRG